MNSLLKSAWFSLALLAAPFSLAQVTLHDFSTFESPDTFFFGDWELNGEVGGSNSPRFTFSQGAGVYNFVGGLDDDASSAFHFLQTPLNITGLTLLEVSARVLAGNTAPAFTLTLFDSSDKSALATFSSAAFSGPDFVTFHAPLTYSAGFDQTEVSAFLLSGNFIGGTQTLNLVANHFAVVPVPEPSSYGLLAALTLVGAMSYRRIRRST